MNHGDQVQVGFAHADEGLAKAESLAQQGDTDASLGILRQVVDKFPGTAEAWARATSILLRERRLNEAEEWVSQGMVHCPGEFRLLHDHARIAEAGGDWASGAARWQAFSQHFPDVWYGDVNAAINLRLLGRLDEAEACLLAVQARLPAEPEPFLEYPRPAEARRDWDEALRRWAAARERFPDHWRVYAGAAACQRELGNLTAAEALLAEGQMRNPAEKALFIDAARIAESERDWEFALRKWSDMTARFPGEWIGYAGAANALRELRRDTEAEGVLAAAREQCPNEPSLYASYAGLAEARGDWEAALQRWNEARGKFPGQVGQHARAAGCLVQLRRYEEADALLADAADRFPREFMLFAERARLAVRRGDRNGAVSLWHLARERFPQERDAWINETQALADAGRNAEALACIEAARLDLPSSFEVRVAAASLQARLHLLDQALATWQGLRDEFPDQPISYVRGADALQDAGRGDEAETLLSAALQRFPNDSGVNRAYALSAARRNDLAGAAQRLEIAAERNKTDLDLAWQWVEAVRQLHRPAEARAVIRTVIDRFPNDAKVKQQAVRVLWQAGERDEAIAIWGSMIGDEATFELARALLTDAPSGAHAEMLLRHLISEPDPGGRYWRPLLATVFRLDRIPSGLASLASRLLQELPPAAFTRAVHDIVQSVLQRDLPDAVLRGFLETYLEHDRLGILGCIFSDLDRPSQINTRIRATFEAYVDDRLREPDWITDAASDTLVAFLQFAACASHAAYRKIVSAARARLNVAALAARAELQTSQGILGSILSSAGTGLPQAPALISAPTKLRVALCISGQLRGYRQAFRSWDQLGLSQHDTTIFVESWYSVGFNWERIWGFLRGQRSLHHAIHTGGLAFVMARYPVLAKALEEATAASGTVTVSQLQDFYETPHVRLDDDTSSAFRRRSNQWKMYYKMARSVQAANESGKPFDVMIRARPDREIIDAAGFDLDQIRAESVADHAMFMLDHPAVIRDGHFWLGDQFAFGTPAVISTYCNILADIESMADAGRVPRDVDLTLPMHVTPFLMTFYRGILVRPIPDVEFGNFVNPPLLTVQEIYDLVTQDLQAREAEEFDLRLLQVCKESL